MGDRVQSTFAVAVLTAATAAFTPLLAQNITKTSPLRTESDPQGAAIARGTDAAPLLALHVQTGNTDFYCVDQLQAAASDVTASEMDLPSKAASNVAFEVAAKVNVDFSPGVSVVSESSKGLGQWRDTTDSRRELRWRHDYYTTGNLRLSGRNFARVVLLQFSTPDENKNEWRAALCGAGI